MNMERTQGNAMKNNLHPLTAVALACLLAACGGGGNDGSSPTESSANEQQDAPTLTVNQAAGTETGVDEPEIGTTAASGVVTVRARGSLAQNVGPVIELRVQGATVGRAEVRSATNADYPFQVGAIPAGATVEVVFNNDLMVNGQDRNLFIDSVTVNDTRIASNAQGVVFDRGTGALAFDNIDVLPGLSTLWWNGALRLKAPAGTTGQGGTDPVDTTPTPPTPANPNATGPGAIANPFPTLQNITLEWAFSGDANANAQVGVRYRVRGTTAWSTGMPLRRVSAGSNVGFSWRTRHSGSVFNLQPNTTYEIELTLTDPDGGSITRTRNVATRAVPAPMANAPVKNATPATLASLLGSANPGDIIQLGAGSYGSLNLTRSGQAGRPVVLRGASGAVIRGEIFAYNLSHVMLQGLTLEGAIRFNGSKHFSVVRSTINANANVRNGDGITTQPVDVRAENAYIADNIVTGTTPWADGSLGSGGNNRGEGIQVTGPGHVIMNNRVSRFRDNISLFEEGEAQDQFSIDILNNDLREAADDGVEADFCAHNCRIMRNRLTNTFVGLSSQPGLGGPTYFIRNSLYNVAHVPFKLYRDSRGDVLLHNTVVKGGDALGIYAGTPLGPLYARNNLFIGGPGGTFGGYGNGSGRVIDIATLNGPNMDHDGFGSTTGFNGRIGGSSFASLAQLRSVSTEKNAVQVDPTVFAASIGIPTAALTVFAAPDLRLRPGSAAENAGVAIPNVNDGFSGRAPDLGAFEVGAPLPVVGPR
jgi:hypothetical protein